MAGEFVYKINDALSIVAKMQGANDLEYLTQDEKGLCKTEVFHLYKRLAIDTSEIEIGRFCLSPLPGCCGVIVVHNMSLTERTRHSGLSDPVRDLKTKLCKALGYSLMIATTRMDQIPAVGNLFKSKYRFVETFTNKRTTNLIGIGIKKI